MHLFKKKSFYMVLFIVICFVFLYFPRKLIWVLPDDIRVQPIELLQTYGNQKTIHLSERQQADLVELLSHHFVRVKLIKTKYVNTGEMGIQLFISGRTDSIFFFSEDIIVINGVQYKIYGKSLADDFKNILEREDNL